MTKDEALALCEKLSFYDDGHRLITLDDIEHLLDEIFPEKKKALAVQVPNEYTNINQDAFNEWLAYKKYKNKGAITKTLKMLNKYDYKTQQDMVDKSIMNEYKGLFEPKGSPKVVNEAVFDNNIYDLIDAQEAEEKARMIK